MNEEAFNLSIRKFLKKVGVGSQHEIEQAVYKAIEDGQLKGTETLPTHMTLEIGELSLKVDFDGKVELE
ncbi:hypothetical protein SAMN05661010_01037 [Modicisalibacter muralis]|uniref:Uncharacterized protein n=1 Tax=Modicisalibacter muralis TaxID=119000 RepID=A0A1G9I452_9GAMM|nr:DUF6494 family protein [Halomonas muralis]SDL19846.1 hypothetical protein SAMN05661010_01037 [Halomonas muralis]